jgi:hypothetical protein
VRNADRQSAAPAARACHTMLQVGTSRLQDRVPDVMLRAAAVGDDATVTASEKVTFTVNCVPGGKPTTTGTVVLVPLGCLSTTCTAHVGNA